MTNWTVTRYPRTTIRRGVRRAQKVLVVASVVSNPYTARHRHNHQCCKQIRCISSMYMESFHGCKGTNINENIKKRSGTDSKLGITHLKVSGNCIYISRSLYVISTTHNCCKLDEIPLAHLLGCSLRTLNLQWCTATESTLTTRNREY